jgi:hypothetical protein
MSSVRKEHSFHSFTYNLWLSFEPSCVTYILPCLTHFQIDAYYFWFNVIWTDYNKAPNK